VEDLIRNGVLFGGLLGLGLLAWRTRWRAPALGLALLLGLPLAWHLGALAGSLGVGVPLRPGALLAAWVLFAHGAAAAGGPRLSGPAWLVAPLLGAAAGDWGAALLLAPLAPTPVIAGRWVLAAMAGAMIVPHGTPALALLAPQAGLGLLPLVLVALAAPPGRLAVQGSLGVTGVLGVVIAVAWCWPAGLMPTLLAAAVSLAVVRRRLPSPPLPSALVGLALLVGLVWLTRHAGLLFDLGWGFDQLARLGGGPGLGGLTVLAAVAAGLGSELAGALVATSALDASIAASPPAVARALAAGLAVGGIGPLLLAGALRASLARWALGVLVAALWAGWVLP